MRVHAHYWTLRLFMKYGSTNSSRKRFDDPIDDDDFSEERTVSRAVIRSIDKDDMLRIPFSENAAKPERARPLIDALQSCFQIMRLQLDAEDDPQIIFETLNARGTPLQPSDLLRNFLFLTASRNGEESRTFMTLTGKTSTKSLSRAREQKGPSSGRKRSVKDA
jgi:hypothetical protein